MTWQQRLGKSFSGPWPGCGADSALRRRRTGTSWAVREGSDRRRAAALNRPAGGDFLKGDPRVLRWAGWESGDARDLARASGRIAR